MVFMLYQKHISTFKSFHLTKGSYLMITKVCLSLNSFQLNNKRSISALETVSNWSKDLTRLTTLCDVWNGLFTSLLHLEIDYEKSNFSVIIL